MGMMGVVAAVLGAIAGSLVLGFAMGMDLGPAAFLGAAIGFLLAEIRSLRRQVMHLQEQVLELMAPAGKRVVSQTEARAAAPIFDAVSNNGPAPALPPAGAEAAAEKTRPSPQKSPPDVFDRLWQLVKSYFTEGNLIVRVGVLVLLFGVGFLVKYTAERTELSVAAGLASVLAGGLALFSLGWYLRSRREGYGWALQGGGLGIIYLTLFASLRLYEMISPALAFPLMVLLVLAAGVLSVVQNAQILALLALAGGFLAPILTAAEGSHVILFSYFLILNIGIAAIAWFRTWRFLNLLGFGFTFVLGTAWGVLRYQPEYYFSTQPFLIAFFLLYVAIAVLFASRRAPLLRDVVDGSLVFGTPLTAFALQAALVEGSKFGLAWSAATVALFYGVLCLWLRRKNAVGLQPLRDAFFALAVAFATLVVPLALDERWTAATWSLEALALIWIGTQQQRRLPIVAALVMFVGAGVSFLLELSAETHLPALPFLNSNYLGGILMAAMAGAGAYLLDKRYGQQALWQKVAVVPLLLFAIAWSVGIGLREVDIALATANSWALYFIYLALLALALSLLQLKLVWRHLEPVPVGLLLVMLVFGMGYADFARHPFAGLGGLAWFLAGAILFAQLWFWERRGWLARIQPWPQIVGVWLVVFVLAVELYWQSQSFGSADNAWRLLTISIPPLLALAAAIFAPIWPFAPHRLRFVTSFAYPLVALLLGWLLYANLLSNGDASPLPFAPLLNPLDLACIAIFALVLQWRSRLLQCAQPSPLRHPGISYLLLLLGFIWFNAMLLRTLHHWAGVPFDFGSLMNSVLVQASLSIIWTLMGLAAAIFATRNGQRAVWSFGAALIAVVVVKLFTVDLSGSGTLERIVSFLGVGSLLLLVGYFAPMPAARTEEADGQQTSEPGNP